MRNFADKIMRCPWAGPVCLQGKAAKQPASTLELPGKLASNGNPLRHLNFDTFLRKSMKFSATPICGFLAIPAAALLLALSARAQVADTPAAAAPSHAASAEATAPAPRYAAADLQQAFNFMDANRDGKISREEAAGFRGVARHFDQADADKDGFLSRGEFDAAMNYVKPK